MSLLLHSVSKSVHTDTNYKQKERYQSDGNGEIFQVKIKYVDLYVFEEISLFMIIFF